MDDSDAAKRSSCVTLARQASVLLVRFGATFLAGIGCSRRASAPEAASASMAPAAASAIDGLVWNPAMTRVFVVALARFEGEAPGHTSFTTQDRNDVALVALLEARGVPADHIAFLQDADATSANVRMKLAASLAMSQPGELLLFYFGSHGGYDPASSSWTFSTFDGQVPMGWALDAIDAGFKGSHALLFADSCYSGGLVALARARRSRVAYAAISSTYSHDTAWSGWRFVDAMMRGLSGDAVADLDGDGDVTLDELGRFITRHMAFVAEGMPERFASPGFPAQAKLAHVQRPKLDARIGTYESVEWKAAWYNAEVDDAKGDRLHVHYTSYDHSWDEWVGPARIKDFVYPTFEVGVKVDVERESETPWSSAKVLDRWEWMHLVRFDGLGPEYDQWVGPSRIRAVGHK